VNIQLYIGSALEQKNKWVFYFWSLPHLAIIPIEGAVLFELGAHRQKYSHGFELIIGKVKSLRLSSSFVLLVQQFADVFNIDVFVFTTDKATLVVG
jgi:hypothetical protein